MNFKQEASSNTSIRLDPHLGSEISQSLSDDLEARRHLREVFAVRLDRGEAAQFDVTSEKFDAIVRIYSEQGDLLAEDDDSGGDTNARLYFANLQGKSNRFYVVVATAGEREGRFNLAISKRPTPAADAAERMSEGRTIKGSLTPASPLRIKDQRVYKSYYFDGAIGDRVQISAMGDAVDVELSYNGQPITLSSPNRAGGSSIFRTLENAGRHDIAILGDPAGKSAFEVKLQKLPPPRAFVEPSLVTVGQSVEGAFREDSPVLPGTNNRPYSLFRVEGRQGQQILVSAALAKTGTEVRPSSLTVDVGVDSPAGFAAVRQTYQPHSSGVRRGLVRFERDGPVLIRVAAPTGTFGQFTLNVEPAAAEVTSQP